MATSSHAANLQQIALEPQLRRGPLPPRPACALCTPAASSDSTICCVLPGTARFDLGEPRRTCSGVPSSRRSIPNVYTVPFDYLNLLTTPRGLNITNATVATRSSARSGAAAEDHGAGSLDAPWARSRDPAPALRRAIVRPRQRRRDSGIYNKIDSRSCRAGLRRDHRDELHPDGAVHGRARPRRPSCRIRSRRTRPRRTSPTRRPASRPSSGSRCPSPRRPSRPTRATARPRSASRPAACRACVHPRGNPGVYAAPPHCLFHPDSRQ
jgi:hypothetical protein